MKFVDEAQHWYKMFSVQALLVIAAVQSVLVVLPPATAAAVICYGVTWRNLGVALTVTAAVLGAVGRLIDQEFHHCDGK